MHFEIRRALPEDAPACVHMRGMTRENAVSPERLRDYGITAASWAEDIRSNALPGYVCHAGKRSVGYAFGARLSGEVVVLALLPDAEAKGLGRRLLDLVIQELRAAGHVRLFLGCSADPSSRSHGFYRHLGWRSTGAIDQRGRRSARALAPGGCRSTPRRGPTPMKIVPPNRAVRSYTQHLVGPPEAVFPLLCPVREADWIEGWDPLLVVSHSGVAEPDCVFTTAAAPADAIWYITRHEPEDGFVEMLKITPSVTALSSHHPGSRGRRWLAGRRHLRPHQPRARRGQLRRLVHRGALLGVHAGLGGSVEPLPEARHGVGQRRLSAWSRHGPTAGSRPAGPAAICRCACCGRRTASPPRTRTR